MDKADSYFKKKYMKEMFQDEEVNGEVLKNAMLLRKGSV